MDQFMLGIDIGTTSVKVILFDPAGRPVRAHGSAYGIERPRARRVSPCAITATMLPAVPDDDAQAITIGRHPRSDAGNRPEPPVVMGWRTAITV
ncbi:hypothetical protein E1263_40915 [Kribbella antibiotica]|uniref:Carbohydrate kinase FGGY N-terminal domain-containing protein n=1 Tax=Kribbella antibiotica TaxID=190195 RepID=A0A4R4YHR3_9ACTN|nr:hypothetical protein [Kribbella antibiotica]TDD44353.1 hypothetical protein E1263_40915 [Kribbella antibiotica]